MCSGGPGNLLVPVAESLRQPCVNPPGADQVITDRDLADYSLQQGAEIAACDGRRAALLQAIDAHNAKVKAAP